MSKLADVDLRKLNSATQYPSIPTYHAMGSDGVLQDIRPYTFTERVIGTEKVDGSNGRIIVLPSGEWLIGSRTELLTAQGDVVANPAQGIVAAFKADAGMLDRAAEILALPDRIVTAYLEVYGGRETPNWKNYSDGTPGFRLFDISKVRVSTLDMSVEQISAWRQRGAQEFFSEAVLATMASLTGVPLVPRLFDLEAGWLPLTVEDTGPFLSLHSTTTRVPIGDAPAGRSEGMVWRSADRSLIVKVRHQDYAKAAKRRERQAKDYERALLLAEAKEEVPDAVPGDGA